jgi:hypothetical protein
MSPVCRGPPNDAGASFFPCRGFGNFAEVSFFPAGATEMHTGVVVFHTVSSWKPYIAFFFHTALLKSIHGQLFSIQRRLELEHDDLLVMQGFLENRQWQFVSRLAN